MDEASWRVVTFVLGAVPILGAVWLVARYVLLLKREGAASSVPRYRPITTIHDREHLIVVRGEMTNVLMRLADSTASTAGEWVRYERDTGTRGGGPRGLGDAGEASAEALDRLFLAFTHGDPLTDDALDDYPRERSRRLIHEARLLPGHSVSLGRGEGDPLSGLSAEELVRAAEASHRSVDRALAELMVRLGPPPHPVERALQPTGTGDGGAQS
ncbi:hypothetical protein ACFYNV_28935 [Streptomyces albidoflavus]